MKRQLDILGVVLTLGILGFLGVNFAGGKSYLSTKQDIPVPEAPPTALAGFGEIELVPFYPGANVTFTDNESVDNQHISYEVDDSRDRVNEFYNENLPKKGWSLRNRRGQSREYIWTDPDKKLLWNMHLNVTVEWTLYNTATTVYLEYGRYPNIEEGLPLYPDAQNASVTHSNIEKSFPSGKTRVRVTDTTYFSSANPQEIATFYSGSMQEYGWHYYRPGWSTEEYGWFPFDDPGSWGGNNSKEGLYFVASRPRLGEKSGVVSTHLLATSILQNDGRALIRLHVEEYESSLGNF